VWRLWFRFPICVLNRLVEKVANREQELTASLQRVVLPVLAIDQVGTAHYKGTGFLIVSIGRTALMVTAAHVTNAFKTIENPLPRHHPTSQFQPVRYRFEFKRVRPCAIYQDPELGGVLCSIVSSVEMAGADLALCEIQFQDGVTDDLRFQSRFAIDSTPVEVGERILATGYGKMPSTIEANATGQYEFAGGLSHRSGFVTHVYHDRGPRGQRNPCFEVSIPLFGGMSGGPLTTVDENGIPSVRGIVSYADVQNPEDPTAINLGSMLWPLMMMPVNSPAADGTITGKMLIDLERECWIVDKGRSSEHIKLRRGPDGQIETAHWEP
jgi:hypothetical protein